MIIELEEDLVIKQDSKKVILEKGDRIEVLEAAPKMKVSSVEKAFLGDLSTIRGLLDDWISMTSRSSSARSLNRTLSLVAKKLDDVNIILAFADFA